MLSETDKIATEAAVWLARLERGMQAQEGASLCEWLKHPAQRDAIVDAAKLWHGPDIVAVLAQLVPVGFGQPPRPPERKLTPIRMLIGLGVGFFALLPFFLIHRATPGLFRTHYPQRPADYGETLYATRPGETRVVTLDDGSEVTLNGHSRLGILFNISMRVATLDYGEAIFHIAGERRPFELNAAGRHFAVAPSTFDARVNGARSVDLMVVDGAVTVRGLPWRWPDTPSEARLFDPAAFADTTVGALQAVSLEDSLINRHTVTAAAAHAQLRWQPERVIYVNP